MMCGGIVTDAKDGWATKLTIEPLAREFSNECIQNLFHAVYTTTTSSESCPVTYHSILPVLKSYLLRRCDPMSQP